MTRFSVRRTASDRPESGTKRKCLAYARNGVIDLEATSAAERAAARTFGNRVAQSSDG